MKVTDAAGKWKKYTSNALGQLTQVNEPNPAGGSDYVTIDAARQRAMIEAGQAGPIVDATSTSAAPEEKEDGW